MEEVFTWEVLYEVPESLREKERSLFVVTKEDSKDAAEWAAVKSIRRINEGTNFKNFSIKGIEALNSAYMEFD